MVSNWNTLEAVRWKLDRLCLRRAEPGFSEAERDLYVLLSQVEAELLQEAC